MPESLNEFFSSGFFMPHGHCYLWKPGLVWLQVLSNGLRVSRVAHSRAVHRVEGTLRLPRCQRRRGPRGATACSSDAFTARSTRRGSPSVFFTPVARP